jgi:hypothetical protein
MSRDHSSENVEDKEQPFMLFPQKKYIVRWTIPDGRDYQDYEYLPWEKKVTRDRGEAKRWKAEKRAESSKFYVVCETHDIWVDKKGNEWRRHISKKDI